MVEKLFCQISKVNVTFDPVSYIVKKDCAAINLLEASHLFSTHGPHKSN